MVLNRQAGNPLDSLTPVLTREALTDLQDAVDATFMNEKIADYVVSLISATRANEALLRGASPRTSLSVAAMAKAVAQLRGRDYVVPGDVKEVFSVTTAHRLLLSPRAEAEGRTAEQILQVILDSVPAPRLR